MYQRYPDEARSRAPSPTGDAPQSVLRAVRVMYVGLAANLIGIVVDMTTLSATRSEILKQNPGYTQAQLNNAEHLQIGLFIAGGLIGAALWLWMAQSCRAGKGWARVVSTVFFGIETLSVLAGATAVQSGGLTRTYGFVVWVIGLIAVVLLWQRSSSAYFRAPRY
jgi:uncharacterized membrane protein